MGAVTSAPPFQPAVLFVNRDGEWFHQGEKITHEKTWKAFSQNLRVEQDRLVVRIGKEFAEVQAEDAPLIVSAVRENSDGIDLILIDERVVPLDPHTLTIDGSNVPYCTIDGVHARFSRQAYYQLASHIRQSGDGFELVLPSGRSAPIAMG